MKNTKKIIPIGIFALFLSLALAPIINADGLDQELEIAFSNSSGYTFYKKIIVAPEKLERFDNNFTIWENNIKEFDLDNKINTSEIFTFIEITCSLINEIKELTYDLTTGVYNFPEPLLSDDAIAQFIKYHLLLDKENFTISTAMPVHLQLRRILSIGRGRAWLPLTDLDEAFIGMRFLPIFLQYSVGYAKSRWLNLFPPSICIEDRLGKFNIVTMGFVGLYINFGKIYINNPTGPILLIGKQAWQILGEDKT